MKLEQIYTGCIAHAAYYLESNGEAAIFDPLREVEPYIDRAKIDNAKIKYVFETHFHADFVSGHLDLAKKAGAIIVYGPTAKPGFQAMVGEDGQLFKVGDCTVKLIHTPGHTLESTTYLIIDEKGIEHGIITGDTLFIGDVGRPDLAQHVIAELTQEKLAGMLYDSLREKIMPLSDELIVYPNHGAGSACGKKMSKETTDTLGHQKKVNYALRPEMTKDEFIKELLSGLTAPPGYFPQNVLLNIKGYESLDEVLERAKKGYSVSEFKEIMKDPSLVILDTRDAEEFSQGFITGSINIGLNGNFAQWVGEMISDIKQKFLLITDPGKEQEALIRLSRVGYDYAIGYLEGGIQAWCAEGNDIDTIERISASVLMSEYHSDPIIFDVRKRSEFDSEHIINAKNIPLNEIYKRLEEFPMDRAFVIHCAGGYRSMIAASILKSKGFENFREVRGGMTEIRKTALPLTEYVCPTTLL
ncbi:MAG: MBL fold metallo-hydrolase [Bacteroidetes bacterium]|nr:MAG: MBL fold metallo-hydrolase [Bacteroidota bacterium]